MKRYFLIILAAALLLCGCVADQGGTAPQLVSKPTVEDIFTIPPTTAPAGGTVPGVTEPVGTTESSKPNQSVPMGSMNFGVVSESQRDEKGRYHIYEGGQMHLRFEVNTTGTVSDYDVGILLFIDGIAQPYRVGPDGEYAYMHTFSQKDGTQMLGTTTTIADIHFTPITGEEGDMLEFYALCMLNPHHVPSQGLMPFSNTFGAVLCAPRLKYNATPPEETYPEKSTRLLDVKTSAVDCTALDVKDWTDVDMITNQRTAFTANREKAYVYGVTPDTLITLRYEVWGSPYVHYGLIFFVDNEPVYTADLADIWVTVKMGQKTVIEATLDMTGFSGESAVYAILVPRNYRTSEIETNATFHEGSTIFLLAKEKNS